MAEEDDSNFDWRVHLRSCREEILSGPSDMESAYQKIIPSYEGQFWADRLYAEEFDNALEALSHYTGEGVYPPPELLDVVDDLFKVYLASNGRMSLEQVFFGAKGTFAKRETKYFKKVQWQIALISGKNNGRSLQEVAEKFVQNHDYPADPESLLRWHDRNSDMKALWNKEQ